jgi:hypothetical protein
MTFVTDNSGNKMGIVQLGGIRYKFVKPIFGSVMLTPVSETPLNYLFQAPDLTLPQGNLLDRIVPKDPLQDLLGAFNSDSKRTKSGEPNAETRTKFGDKKGKYPIFDLQSLKSAIALRGHSPNPEEILDRAEEWAKLKGNKAALAMVAKARMVDKLKAKV